MAKIKSYQRTDVTISLRRTGEKEVQVHLVGPYGLDDRRTLPFRYFRDWLRHPDRVAFDLPHKLGLTTDSPLWADWPSVGTGDLRRRLLLNIADHDLAGLPWEAAFAAKSLRIPIDVIARTSPVLPRNQSSPMTLPLRILQVGDVEPLWSPNLIDGLFGPENTESVSHGIQISHCAFEEVERWREKSEWSRTSVLLFDSLPTLADPEQLFLVDEPEQAGTLGWLTRLVNSWQTRLVILYCYTAQQATEARRLATAVIQQGGPACLVGWQAEPQVRTLFSWTLNHFLHDEPLDYLPALSLMLDETVGQALIEANPVSLFIGAGRADSLRFSPLMETFVNRAVLFGSSRRLNIAAWWPEMYSALDEPSFNRPQNWTARRNAMWQMGKSLGKLRTGWDRLDFSHEGEVFKLASETTDAIRDLGKLNKPVPWHVAAFHNDISVVGGLPQHPFTDSGRYVNSYLAERQSDKVTQLPQTNTTLLVGQTYHLCIQIGPRNPQIVTLGETALAEEVFKWQPRMQGVWLEVGVTGLDFKVLGNPIQPLWLPKPGNKDELIITEPIFFAVVPQTVNVAQLRFTLYYKNDVIQSFRLAALTTEGLTLATAENGRALLANALEVPESKVGNRRYLTRLEYSIVSDLTQLPARLRQPVLSIVANHHHGKSVLTTKGAELFSIQTPCDLPKKVADVRKELDDISAPDGKTYVFGSPAAPNEGDENRLKTALQKLAKVGWDLYITVSKVEDRISMQTNQQLSGEGGVIHTAHISLDKAIPWQLIYDRQYSPNRRKYDHEVCLAVMPGPDGSAPAQRCVENPQCVLHEDQRRKREAEGKKPVRKETVVCPWHFWGFRHQIEAPAQQTDDEQGRELYNCVFSSKDTAQLLLGVNHTLLAEEHLEKFKSIVAGAGLVTSWPEDYLSDIDDILDALENSELDIIYFLCHARGGEIEGSEEKPHLEFDPPDGIIMESDLPEIIWSHHPLVFLNGCHTAGFSPHSISPFVRSMSQMGASGVVGTEISVFDRLAEEVAERFMENFLNGEDAGTALLMVRRQLLAQYNPLGLAYTLFAAASLRLDLSGDGCQR